MTVKSLLQYITVHNDPSIQDSLLKLRFKQKAILGKKS